MTMPDITMTDIDELRTDLGIVLADIGFCVRAIERGIWHYGKRKSMAQRLKVNGRIAERISVELQRREMIS